MDVTLNLMVTSVLWGYQKMNTMYPLELVMPMAAELTDKGFKDLTTADEVDAFMESQKGTVLIVVNSVCGCAAANARPGAILSFSGNKRPDVGATVFAGVHKEATDKARQYMLPYPPSSPSIALFKGGKLVHMLERHHIEGRPAELISENLQMAYDAYCD